MERERERERERETIKIRFNEFVFINKSMHGELKEIFLTDSDASYSWVRHLWAASLPTLTTYHHWWVREISPLIFPVDARMHLRANDLVFANIIALLFIFILLQQRFPFFISDVLILVKNYGRLIFMPRIHSDFAHTVLTLITFRPWPLPHISKSFHSFVRRSRIRNFVPIFSFPHFENWPKRGPRESRVSDIGIFS